MTPTGSLIPARLDMTAVIGGDFQASAILYQDLAQSTPFDLTGYTAEVDIGGTLLVLTPGSGLTITTATGTVAMTITHDQTALLLGPAQHYALKLTDGSGKVSFPVSGSLFLIDPTLGGAPVNISPPVIS